MSVDPREVVRQVSAEVESRIRAAAEHAKAAGCPDFVVLDAITRMFTFREIVVHASRAAHRARITAHDAIGAFSAGMAEIFDFTERPKE